MYMYINIYIVCVYIYTPTGIYFCSMFRNFATQTTKAKAGSANSARALLMYQPPVP